MANDKEFFYDAVKKIVQTEISNLGLLNGNWHLGEVVSIVNSFKLMVCVDGSTTPQEISYNPDVSFKAGDQVWVIFINGKSRDKFVLCKRAF
ncbi:hypothetical protein [Paenibacillus medicaginis]|uniref:Uncharacterized protein n=1 Tax=Paenibacillus medicaginis TaxID=1470560 RepID=A0ABV5BVF1_9BACL